MISQPRIGRDRSGLPQRARRGLKLGSRIGRRVEETPDPEGAVSHPAVTPRHHREERAPRLGRAFRGAPTGAPDHGSRQAVRQHGECRGLGGEVVDPALPGPCDALLGRRARSKPRVDDASYGRGDHSYALCPGYAEVPEPASLPRSDPPGAMVMFSDPADRHAGSAPARPPKVVTGMSVIESPRVHNWGGADHHLAPPGSARPGVGGEHDGALVVRVSAPLWTARPRPPPWPRSPRHSASRRTRLVAGTASRRKIVDSAGTDRAAMDRPPTL